MDETTEQPPAEEPQPEVEEPGMPEPEVTPEPEPEVPVTEPEPGNDDEPAEPAESEPLSFAELSSLADSGDLTSTTLQNELQKYTQAYREEFELASSTDPTNVEAYTLDFFKKNVPAAAAQIVHLATSAESESVRGNMSKYIIEQATKDSENDGDPIKELLNQLSKPKAATS